MVLVKCLYCDAENDAIKTAGYCDSCGKKLPPASMVRARRSPMTDGSAEASPELPAVRTRAAEALFTTAVVQLIVGGLFLVLGPALFRAVPESFLPTALLWTVVPTAVLAGLGVWARRAARPAVLTALAVYLLWVALGFVIGPDFAWGWLVVHLVLFALLAWVAWVGLGSR